MMAALPLIYSALPSKFDYTQYYLNQAAGGPSFPVYRARQKGGSFLAPFIRRHGLPFLKWVGRQAASLASGVGNTYLNKGNITKADMKDLMKQQGKDAAHSVLDKIKQQVGAGTMTHRRDARLSALIPMTTSDKRNGILTNQHRVRPPMPHEGVSTFLEGSAPKRKTTTRRKPRKTKHRSKSNSGKKKSTRHAKKGQSGKLNAGLRKYLAAKKKAKKTKKNPRSKGARNKKPSHKKKSSKMSLSKNKIARNPFAHTIFS